MLVGLCGWWLLACANTAAVVSKKVDVVQLGNTRTESTSSEEGDAHILKLAQSGDKPGAVKLTRKIYGCFLREAVELLGKLQSKGRLIGQKSFFWGVVSRQHKELFQRIESERNAGLAEPIDLTSLRNRR